MGSGQTEGRTIAHVRRQEIADMLRADGSVTVAQMEERFGVSSMTARRDLAELERRGLARRTHGGAVLPSAAGHEDSFLSRLTRSSDAKLALARAAAELVAEEDSVFLDTSSTAYHVAREILDRTLRVTLLTNSQPIMELVASPPPDHGAGPLAPPPPRRARRHRRHAAPADALVRRPGRHHRRAEPLRRPL